MCGASVHELVTQARGVVQCWHWLACYRQELKGEIDDFFKVGTPAMGSIIPPLCTVRSLMQQCQMSEADKCLRM